MANKAKKVKDAIKVRGSFRVNVETDGKITGDSGWVPNQITNLGFERFLCALVAKTTNSAQVAAITLGTGSAPASNATTLPGEISTAKRKTPTVTAGGSTNVQFRATFGSTDSFLAGASNISNIGLFDVTNAAGQLFAGNTYASSSCDTNQNVNCTYQISFA